MYVSTPVFTAASAGSAASTCLAHNWLPDGLVGFFERLLQHLSRISHGWACEESRVARFDDVLHLNSQV